MKKICFIFAVCLLINQSVFAQNSPIQSIDVSSGSGTADLFVQRSEDQNPNILREVVTAGSTSISASIKMAGDNASSPKNIDLGDINIELILQVFENDGYLPKFIVEIEDKKNNKQVAQQSLKQPSQSPVFSPQGTDRLVREMNFKLALLFLEEQEKYGAEFLQAVRIFTEEYIRGVMDSSSEVMNSMIEKNAKLTLEASQKAQASAPVEKTPTAERVAQAYAYDPAMTPQMKITETQSHKKIGNKDQKNYQREEALNIRPEEFSGQIILMPEYLTATSFDLFEKDNPTETDLAVANIQYFVAIVPTPYGQYQTTFILEIDYKSAGKLKYVKTVVHPKNLDEEAFFIKWREQFLTPALIEFVSKVASEKEKEVKNVFAQYLEPFMFDEYYDFLPLFTKAKVVFDSPETQRKLQQELENYQAAYEAHQAAKS